MKPLKTNVRGKMFIVQLLFYSEMALKLQPFLLKFQSDVPLVPFLATDLNKMYLNVLAV